MHKFPSNMQQQQAWIRAINRCDFTVTTNTRVCSLHFLPSDFKESSSDRNTSRRMKKDSSVINRRILKESAIPSIFHGQPKYLSRALPHQRTGNSSTEARQRKSAERIDELERSMKESDRVSDLNDFEKDFVIPSGFDKIRRSSNILFVYLNENGSSIRASVVIQSDLTFEIFFNGQTVPLKKVKYLLLCDKLTTTTELSNILALVKSWCENDTNVLSYEDLLKQVIIDLEKILPDSTNSQLLKFVIEQLMLTLVPKNGRHYSNELFIHAFLWHMTSPALYKVLKELFLLPSVRRLQQLSSGMNVEANIVNKLYLQERTSSLQPYERNMILIIDEIYTAKRVEYSNGTFIGLTSDGKVAKTVLSFMVHSVSSHYKDIVCIIPVNKLCAKDLLMYFRRVMVELAGIVQVVAVSLDNHCVNR